MNLVGNLEDLGLGEILQIVSLSRKSGILTLNGKKGEGKIVFSRGEVVRATSPGQKDTLAGLLMRMGAVDPSTLENAISQQEREGFRERLGTILVKRFNVPSETVDKVIRGQIEGVVGAFFSWTDGTFDFELDEHVDMVDTVDTEEMQLMLDQGINSQYLAIEGVRLLDEKHHLGKIADAPLPLPSEPAQAGSGAGPSTGHTAETLPLFDEPCPEPDKRHIIVLVDDHEATREALVSSLEECGYEVYPFAGGADSPLMRIASLHRDGLLPILLIDLAMPKMDGTGNMGGIELLDLIKSNFPELPVLAMGESNSEEAEMEIRGMGYPLVFKPCEDDVCDPGLMNEFMVALLTGLKRVRSGEAAPDEKENVNLGDELRQELGEGTSSASSLVLPSTGIALLRGMLEELNKPALEGGTTLLVLRFAAEFMNRGIIFTVKGDKVAGLGQFGIGSGNGSADSIVRSMKIPTNEDSLFSAVLEGRIAVKAAPDDGGWTGYVLDRLGGDVPDEIFLGPIVSGGKVVAILYGDNLPEKKPIGDTDALEIFLSQAGVAMEKALLQRKLEGIGLEGT